MEARSAKPVCKAMINRKDDLPIARHLEHPFEGARTLRAWLHREGFEAGRQHVLTLMHHGAVPEAERAQVRRMWRSISAGVHPA